MQKTDTLLRFLSNTMDLPVFCWDKNPQILQELGKKYCFAVQIQPFLTAAGVSLILENMHPMILYETSDPLGIHFYSFLFEGKPIWAGPFVVKAWDDLAAEQRLLKAELPASYFSPFKLYYCSLNMLDPSVAARIIIGAIMTVDPKSPPYSCQTITGIPNQKLPSFSLRDPLDLDNAMRQYDLENHFLSLVEEGRTEAALEVWNKLGQIPPVKELTVTGLQNMITNASILRTLTRKAAERGGVHPVVVDTISVAYAQKMYAASSRKELARLLSDMIREFTDAVHEAQKMHYSPQISIVVNYLRLHLSEEIEMDWLAKLAGCSPSYLGKRFKKETGMTLAQFLALERCNTAAVYGPALSTAPRRTFAITLPAQRAEEFTAFSVKACNVGAAATSLFPRW